MCKVYSVFGEKYRKVWYEAESVNCRTWSVKCKLLSVECGVLSIKCKVWSAKWKVESGKGKGESGTVAQRLCNVWQTQPQLPNPKSETRTLATHSGKVVTSNQYCGELCDIFIFGPVSKWGMPMKWTMLLWEMMRNRRVWLFHVQTNECFRRQRSKYHPNWSI